MIHRRHDCGFDLQNDKEIIISQSTSTGKHHNIVVQNRQIFITQVYF
jgi:predicted type IV restriction endonuclease